LIKTHQFYELIRKINNELRLDNAITIQNFANRTFFRTVFLRTDNAMSLYGKIKNSVAMQKFESTYNACLALSKNNRNYVLRINY
jgi:hypothetical protein